MMADFFLDLHREKLAPKTIQGYRAAISHTYKAAGKWDVGKDQDLTSLIQNFFLQRPLSRPEQPDWDLAFVMHVLTEPPYEPLNLAKMEYLTLKTIFLVALASGKRRGELHALLAAGAGLMGNAMVLKFSPDFYAKTYLPESGTNVLDPLVIPSLKGILAPNMTEDMLLCPVRALRIYLDRTAKVREGRKKLFIAHKKGYKKEIAASTISRWICQVVAKAYEHASPLARKLYYPHPKAHQLRGIGGSWAAANKVSLEEIMRACSWKSPTTFTSYYLRDMTMMADNLCRLGPIVVAQNVIGKK